MSLLNNKGIACGGNWIVGHVKVVDVYPNEYSFANILSEFKGAGGCAYNVIINLAKFDPTIKLYGLGMVGQDADGDYIFRECSQYENLNTDQLRRTDQQRTSYSDVFNIKNTNKAIFCHYRGANTLFAPGLVEFDSMPVDLFHLGYLLLLDTMDQEDSQFKTVAARFLHQLQQRNIKTSIDLVSEGQKFHLVPPALRFTNYCIINDTEAEKLTNVPIRSGNKLLRGNLRKIADAIFDQGVNDLVAVHFPEGAYLLTQDRQEIVQPALELPDDFIKGYTGAGDSFCAAVLYGFHNNWSLEQTARFAVCAGAMNLSDFTTTGGISHWKEVLRIQEKFPFRRDIA